MDGREETVYNFEVEDFHTYFVGEAGVWVHNDEGYNSGYKLGVAKSVAENTDHFIHLGNSYNLATSGDTAKTFGEHIDDYANGERLNSQNPDQFDAGYQDGQQHGFWASVGVSVVTGITNVVRNGVKVFSKTAIKESPEEIMKKNQEAGRNFEKEASKAYLEKYGNVQEQITIKSNKSGTKTKVDLGSIDSNSGQIKLGEAKSSKTAPLTKNQKKAFPEIEKCGGVVCGKGKPGFEGGKQIPPTKIEIIRGN